MGESLSQEQRPGSAAGGCGLTQQSLGESSAGIANVAAGFGAGQWASASEIHEPALLSQLVQLLGQRPRSSLLLSDLGALLPQDLRHAVKERGGLRSWLQKFPDLFVVSGQPGKESVTLLLGPDGGAASALAGMSPGTSNPQLTAALTQQAAHSQGQQAQEDEEHEAAVQLRGLPYRATVADIRRFLGSHANNLRDQNAIQLVLNRDGRPSGFARVQFNSKNAAVAARHSLHLRSMDLPGGGGSQGGTERYVEVFLFSERPNKLRFAKKNPPVGGDDGDCGGITKEEVIQQCREHMSAPGQSQLLLSMLGVALSAPARAYLKKMDQGLKSFLVQYPNEFLVDGSKGRELITYLPAVAAGAGLTMPAVNTKPASAGPMTQAQAWPNPAAISTMNMGPPSFLPDKADIDYARQALGDFSFAAPPPYTLGPAPTFQEKFGGVAESPSWEKGQTPKVNTPFDMFCKTPNQWDDDEPMHAYSGMMGNGMNATGMGGVPMLWGGDMGENSSGSANFLAPSFFAESASMYGLGAGADGLPPSTSQAFSNSEAAFQNLLQSLAASSSGAVALPSAATSPAGTSDLSAKMAAATAAAAVSAAAATPQQQSTAAAAAAAQAVAAASPAGLSVAGATPAPTLTKEISFVPKTPQEQTKSSGLSGSLPTWKVLLRGLPWTATEQDVLAFFAKHEVVEGISDDNDAVKMIPKANGKPSGQAMVTMTSRADAEQAQEVLHGKHIDTRFVEVSLINEQQERESASNSAPPSAAATPKPADDSQLERYATPPPPPMTTTVPATAGTGTAPGASPHAPQAISPAGGMPLPGAGDTGGSGGSNGAEAMVNAAAQALLAARSMKGGGRGAAGPAMVPVPSGAASSGPLTQSMMAAAAAMTAAASSPAGSMPGISGTPQGASRSAAPMAPGADLSALAALMAARPGAAGGANAGALSALGGNASEGAAAGARAGMADESQWQTYFNFLKRDLDTPSAAAAAGLSGFGAAAGSPLGLSSGCASANPATVNQMSNTALMSALVDGFDMGGAWPGGLPAEGPRAPGSQGSTSGLSAMTATSGLSAMTLADNISAFSSLPPPATAGGARTQAPRSVLSLTSSLTGEPSSLSTVAEADSRFMF